MKKITFKLFFTVLLVFSGTLQVMAQDAPFPGPGTYRIQVQGEDLYLTLPDDAPVASGEFQTLTYEPLDETTNRQIFNINATEISANDFTLESVISGKGAIEILDGNDISSPVGVRNSVPGTLSNQFDVWNLTRGSGTQFFSTSIVTGTAWQDLSARRRLQNSAQGDNVMIGGGTPVAFDYRVATPLVLSTTDFDTNSIAILNPIKNNTINISGLTSSVESVSVYSLLGSKLLDVTASGSSSLEIDASSLNSGVYIVNIQAGSSVITKKIIKN